MNVFSKGVVCRIAAASRVRRRARTRDGSASPEQEADLKGRLTGGADVEKGALIGRAFTEVAIAIRAQHVHRSMSRLTARPLARHQYDAGRNLVAHTKRDAKRPPLVEELDTIAVLETAALGLKRMENRHGRTLAFPEKTIARECGVTLEVAGGGEQAERPAAGIGRFGGVWLPVGQPRKSLRF